MTETQQNHESTTSVTIRPYRPADHGACRRLWAELTERRRALYPDGAAAAADPGAGFEEYLTRLDLSGIWVADHPEEGVIGLVGLLISGRTGEANPVAVASTPRGQDAGRALLSQLANEARRRGMSRLITSPTVRDTAALHTAHSAGFDRMESVTISYTLTDHGGTVDNLPDSNLNLFDLRFQV